MLARLEIVADEPVAAEPVLDRAGLDRRRVNRLAVRHFALLRDYLVDRNGRSLICFLDPAYVPEDPNKGRPFGHTDPRPQIKEFRWPSKLEENGGPGAWIDYGTGKSCPDVISLVEHVGRCSRNVATDWLRDMTDRLVELPS